MLVIKIKEKIRSNLFLPGYNYTHKNAFVSESESYTNSMEILHSVQSPFSRQMRTGENNCLSQGLTAIEGKNPSPDSTNLELCHVYIKCLPHDSCFHTSWPPPSHTFPQATPEEVGLRVWIVIIVIYRNFLLCMPN